MKGLAAELGYGKDHIVLHCDSQSAIYLVKPQVFHERSKYIDVRVHFIRDIVSSGAVKVQKISTDENPADMLTKAVSSSKYNHCLELVKLIN